MKLSQTNRSKHRSRFVDHIFDVRFEVGGLDICGSGVLDEKHKEMVWEGGKNQKK